ncbi:GntR family transcriptional regulator [Staphylococcus massiliensis]|uniref:GntR family transcriptional regulator n=1 Tax=Staphylococcus massiliensis S46 TaxID=1229783 RepID=K9AWM1_9STAP|nr:GntR family transcriptional regulator [Staphylococcus massiliensis]EKU50496.1 GntR family transcriptional regulator [Staphylococcus massiliensis S46]MCG3398733.1 GntR family transcriptional regulator [Staphylococcus massiliensis]MCG3401294.1 GntR family transcriptional regulator [Staphylococcus massiliensis]MCG3411924.1 GntR family transcriptional regulator [Staphylococcus massiliensis]POA00366.1 GntR family transcriptional regulator [Staphylococcus massiliensis CCUG 55927]
MSTNVSINKVKEWIINEIKEERIQPGESLPGAYDLSRLLDVKTGEVNEAIHELVTEQIITQNFGEGAYVKTIRPFFYPLHELVSINQMIEEKGYRSGTHFLSLDEEVASSHDCDVLNIEPEADITVIERIRTANDEPVVYCLDKVPTAILSAQEYQSHERSILKAIELSSDCNITYARTEIESISYEPYISEALNANPHDALMLLKQIHYDSNDKPILYSLNYLKSSLVKFQTIRKRL